VIDAAIRPGPGEIEAEAEQDDDIEIEEQAEVEEERPQQASRPGKLLDRLLYCGALPRYALQLLHQVRSYRGQFRSEHQARHAASQAIPGGR